MKLVILSDCRVPTLPDGGHGLGRLCHSLATAMAKRGHDVTLWAGEGSQWDGNLVIHDDETERAKSAKLDLETVYIDCSHYHDLSQEHPDYKIIDYVLDGECPHIPKHGYVTTPYCARYITGAKVIPLGIDIDNIPFYEKPNEPHYLSFAAKIHPYKGYDDALWAHQVQSVPVKFVGQRWVDDPLPDWRDVLTGQDFYDFVGQSVGLLHPLKNRSALGGGKMPLEAAAMGVPSIVYDDVSPAGHVEHCVSGFIVKDKQELVDAIADLPRLNRKAMRDWVAETHSIDVMCQGLENAIDELEKATA